jgi:hypothetical protein
LPDGEINTTAHNFGVYAVKTAASCSAVGKEEATCSHNSAHKTERDIAIDPTAHNYGAWSDWTVTKAATQTEEGIRTRTRICANNSEHKEPQTETIAKLDPTSIRDTNKSENRYGIRFAQNVVSDKAVMSIVLPNNERVNNAKIVVYDMTGNVVFETTTGNGEVSWNLTNNAGRFVANGSYLVTAEAKDASGNVYQYSAKLGVKR